MTSRKFLNSLFFINLAAALTAYLSPNVAKGATPPACFYLSSSLPDDIAGGNKDIVFDANLNCPTGPIDAALKIDESDVTVHMNGFDITCNGNAFSGIAFDSVTGGTILGGYGHIVDCASPAGGVNVGNSTGILIDQVVIRDGDGAGVLVQAGSSFIDIDQVEAYNNAVGVSFVLSSNSSIGNSSIHDNIGNGVSCNSTTGNTITNNVINNNGGTDIDCADSTNNGDFNGCCTVGPLGDEWRDNSQPLGGGCFADLCAAGDADNDGVVDASDNCPNNANDDQEDHDGDTIGNVCDSDTLDSAWRAGGAGIYVANTPAYNSAKDDAAGLAIKIKSNGGYLGTSESDVTISGGGSMTVKMVDNTIAGAVVSADPTEQIHWNMLYQKYNGSYRANYATAIDGMAMMIDFPMAAVPGTGDVVANYEITVPAGVTVVSAGQNTVKVLGPLSQVLTQLRVEWGGSGHVIHGRDDGVNLIGFDTVQKELGVGPVILSSPAPAEKTGISWANGQVVVRSEEKIYNNMAYSGRAVVTVGAPIGSTYPIQVKIPEADINKVRASSDFLGLSLAIEAKDKNPDTVPSNSTFTGVGLVLFGHTNMAAGLDNTTLNMYDRGNQTVCPGCVHPIDGLKWLGDGRTTKEYNADLVDTGVILAGGKYKFTGVLHVNYAGSPHGGTGLAFTGGSICDSSDVSEDSVRCPSVDVYKAIDLDAETIKVTDAQSGPVIAGSGNVLIGKVQATLKKADDSSADTNFENAIAGLTVATKSNRISKGWEPVDNQWISHVPLNLTTGAPLAGSRDQGKMIAKVNQVVLTADPNPLHRRGVGVAVAIPEPPSKFTLGAINCNTNPTGDPCAATTEKFPASRISGFEAAAVVGGPANTDANGNPKTADDSTAVPPARIGFANVSAKNNDSGIAVGYNTKAMLTKSTLDGMQYGGILVGTESNTKADVDTSQCLQATDGSPNCYGRTQEYALKKGGQGQEDYAAVTTAGYTAPSHLTVTQSVVCASDINQANCGQVANSAIPAYSAGGVSTCGAAISTDDSYKIFGDKAVMMRSAMGMIIPADAAREVGQTVQTANGPKAERLVALRSRNNLIGVKSPGFVMGNMSVDLAMAATNELAKDVDGDGFGDGAGVTLTSQADTFVRSDASVVTDSADKLVAASLDNDAFVVYKETEVQHFKSTTIPKDVGDDEDGDGCSDRYEDFIGSDPTNPADCDGAPTTSPGQCSEVSDLLASAISSGDLIGGAGTQNSINSLCAKYVAAADGSKKEADFKKATCTVGQDKFVDSSLQSLFNSVLMCQ